MDKSKRTPNMNTSLLNSLLVTVSLFASTQARAEQTNLVGPYLGQKEPTETPEVFAPNAVSNEYFAYGGTFNPDMTEFYYLTDFDKNRNTKLVAYRQKGDVWHKEIISKRPGQPFISPDGKTMHLGRRFKQLTPSGWSEIQRLDSRFQAFPIMRMTASAQGTLVFDALGDKEGNTTLRYARLVDGKYEDPKPLSKPINSGKYTAHPFIAKDESYIIWDSHRAEGFGGSDLYISFRQPDGTWGNAINMGDKINSSGWDAAASVTPDGRFILFHRRNEQGNANIFWVSASIIEVLRDKA